MKKTLIVLLLSISAAGWAQHETVVDGVAAVVGKNIIKYSDVERSYAQVRVRQGVGDAFNNRCAILENLILNQLLVHKGEVDSVEVSDDEVNQYVDYYLKNDLRQYGTREALREAISESIRKKDDDLKGSMASQGTTPRQLTDLIGSLCDLTSGSGDKGTPVVLVQGYFDNYTND